MCGNIVKPLLLDRVELVCYGILALFLLKTANNFSSLAVYSDILLFLLVALVLKLGSVLSINYGDGRIKFLNKSLNIAEIVSVRKSYVGIFTVFIVSTSEVYLTIPLVLFMSLSCKDIIFTLKYSNKNIDLNI